MTFRLAQLPKSLARGSVPAIFGLIIIAMLWAGALAKFVGDTNEDKLEAERTTRNFAMVFEENVLRSLGEIDKALLYLRRSIETRPAGVSYGDIANTTDLLSEIIVQVAIIDARGIMRATNAGPQPPPPTDLSDREHFRVHVGNPNDALFISKPLVGRASGKWSVQLSRHFNDRSGAFAGVVVASLDPAHFTKFYDRIELGSTAGITLIGSDGVVRSSGGQNNGFALGQDISASPPFLKAAISNRDSVTVETEGAEPEMVAFRKVKGYPLWVSVSLRLNEVYQDSRNQFHQNCVVAFLLTVLILIGTERILRVEAKRSEAEAHVARLAAEDPLTGLPNRRVFRFSLERNLKRVGPGGAIEPFAVLFLDLDRFKLINDTLGHGIGDRLLQEVAARLKAELRRGEILARLGGDEFAVVVTTFRDRSDLADLAKRIVDAVALPFDIDNHQLRSGVSVGIAVAPADGIDADELLMAADVALYAVKASARGRFAFFDRAMNAAMSDRRELETDLRAALERGQLELEYQPIMDARSGGIASFEALCRWHHPVRGPISPTVFIPIAEDCGLIHAMGEWALTTACRQAATWPEPIKVGVNLSAVQFAGTNLADIVRRTLKLTGLKPERLELEITESVLLDQSDTTLDTLKRLRSLGVRIAMDDFGTGYSSLSYLRSFPFDKIKVDRSFVASLGQGAEHAALIKAVIDIARALGMKTTAEGVETRMQHEHLAALGCDELQGFLFSRPLTVSKVAAMLSSQAERSKAA